MNATEENVRLLLKALEDYATKAHKTSDQLATRGHTNSADVVMGMEAGYEGAIDAVRAYLEVTDD